MDTEKNKFKSCLHVGSLRINSFSEIMKWQNNTNIYIEANLYKEGLRIFMISPNLSELIIKQEF